MWCCLDAFDCLCPFLHHLDLSVFSLMCVIFFIYSCPNLMKWGTCLFFSTTVQHTAVWMDMYGLAFEWQENIVIPLSCSVCKILKQKFKFTPLYTAVHGCDQSVLIIWYGLSILSRKHDCSPFGLLAILLKDIHFRFTISKEIDMDLFMKLDSKQAAGLLIYHMSLTAIQFRAIIFHDWRICYRK